VTLHTLPNRLPRPSAGRFFVTFGYAWLTIGLFTGTVVLVVAVRGIVHLIKGFGWEQSAQDRVLMGVIGLFVLVSFMMALSVVRALYRQPRRTRQIALGALAVPALASAYAWSNPTRFLTKFAGTESSSVSMKGGPTFIFGSYPDFEALRQLKQRGVTTIISLQDPRVLVELEGIKEERAATEKLGLKLIQAPMLPWVSDNSASLERIKQIALHGRGTYYVHCGLGRDRVNIAKRVIESLEPQTHAALAASLNLKHAKEFDSRELPFERGRLVKLAPGAWLIPYPNADEFFGRIIQGTPGHVILLLDPADSMQARWIATATRAMQQYAITYTLIPTSAGDTLKRLVRRADTTRAALGALLARVKATAPPYTVVVPYTTWDTMPRREPLVRAILKAYGVKNVMAAQPLATLRMERATAASSANAAPRAPSPEATTDPRQQAKSVAKARTGTGTGETRAPGPANP
jgi:hypothetical protein